MEGGLGRFHFCLHVLRVSRPEDFFSPVGRFSPVTPPQICSGFRFWFDAPSGSVRLKTTVTECATIEFK